MTQPIKHIPRGPEFRQRDAFAVAGYSMLCNDDTRSQIPALWQRFAPQIGTVPTQVGHSTFGVCYNGANKQGEITYMAGIAVAEPAKVSGFDVVTIPTADYAVFTHEGSLAHILDTVEYIFGQWVPNSEYELTGTPDFELYDERFDPINDTGELEYWVPIKRK